MGNFPIQGTTYIVYNWTRDETKSVTGHLTEVAWKTTNYSTVMVFFFSALFGSHQDAVAMRAQLAQRDSIRMILPVKIPRYDSNTRTQTTAIEARTYEVRYPPRTAFKYQLTKLDEGVYQLLFYPEIALATCMENESILLLPRNLPRSERRERLYSYLDNRLYCPFMPEWTEAIWEYCEETRMVERCDTLGNLDAWILGLRPRLIREFISKRLVEGGFPLPQPVNNNS